MYCFDTLPPVSPACWSLDLGVTLEEVTKIFKVYKKEVRILMNECKEANFYLDRFIWRKLELEEEYVEPEEKCITSDEEDAVRIEEFEVKNKYGEEDIRKLEDDRVLDETTNLTTICEDVVIQQENLQQKSTPKNYFYNKADE